MKLIKKWLIGPLIFVLMLYFIPYPQTTIIWKAELISANKVVRLNSSDTLGNDAGIHYSVINLFPVRNVLTWLGVQILMFNVEKKSLYDEEDILKLTSDERKEQYLITGEETIDNVIVVANNHVQNNSVIYSEHCKIAFIFENYKIGQVFQKGDIIEAINGKYVKNSEEFIIASSNISLGEKVSISVIRNGLKTNIELIASELLDRGRFNLGVQVKTQTTIRNSNQLLIDQEDFDSSKRDGGPSAGLMLSLEALDQFSNFNLSKGRKIAGSGTINKQGEIGEVGLIDLKLKAAHEADADIFFVAKSTENEITALQTAKQINTTMKVVPVSNLEEAVDFLQLAYD